MPPTIDIICSTPRNLRWPLTPRLVLHVFLSLASLKNTGASLLTNVSKKVAIDTKYYLKGSSFIIPLVFSFTKIILKLWFFSIERSFTKKQVFCRNTCSTRPSNLKKCSRDQERCVYGPDVVLDCNGLKLVGSKNDMFWYR